LHQPQHTSIYQNIDIVAGFSFTLKRALSFAKRHHKIFFSTFIFNRANLGRRILFMFHPTSFVALAIAAFSVFSSGCGGSNDSGSLSSTIASFVVTSPTATRTSNAVSAFLRNGSFSAALEGQADVKPMGEMVNDLKADISGGDPKTIANKIGAMSANYAPPSCYGPAWTDDKITAGGNPGRPTGDLGMVTANASPTDTTACAAAQLNALIGGAPQFANKIIKLQATIVASLKGAGKEAPGVGDSENALSHLPTIPGLTVSEAKIERLADRSDGKAVFKTSVQFTDGSQKSGSVTIWHTPLNDENTDFTGLIQAILPHTAIYRQSGPELTYIVETAANRATNSTDFFDSSTGRINFSSSAFGEDGHRILAKFNTSTNAVTMHYAWQAGELDRATRAFALDIPAGTEGELAGTAYFGYGSKIQLIGEATGPAMNKMYCNWLDFAKSSQPVIQKQTFEQGLASKFLPTGDDHISFAPTESCNGEFEVTACSLVPAYIATWSAAADGHKLVAANEVSGFATVDIPTYSTN
jgi:hypothetical protein